MKALAVFLLMVKLCPLRGPADYDFRWELAQAIVDATDNPQRQATLAKIAFYESTFRASVAACSVKGDHGHSLGAFQVWPRSAAEKLIACGDLAGQAKLALERIEESISVCRHMKGGDKLGIFTHGECVRGNREGRARWAPN